MRKLKYVKPLDIVEEKMGGESLYEIFERLLEENNATAYQVSKATGIDTATFSHWKAGLYTPKIDKLQKIAEYFGVPITYFLE